MRRVLVVGCGGSGGKTLAYMMDQLRADLAPYGIDEIPDVWQFLHLDAPVREENGPEGLPNVTKQGGRYTSIGSQQSYSVLDQAVTSRLAQGRSLQLAGTWMPRDVTAASQVPISEGAGQYRAIGRVLTLNGVTRVREALMAARNRLYSAEATLGAQRVVGEGGRPGVPGVGTFDPAGEVLVLVVGSMAGGSGASMALDVCRLLTTVPGTRPGMTALYLYTTEVFAQSVAEADRTGMNGNTLAMFSEVFASQASGGGGAAGRADTRILESLGLQAEPGPTFARLFPVGARLGGDGAPFGDGTTTGTYRGVGRGLARLVGSDHVLNELTQYDLGNTGSPTGDRSVLGWGAGWDPLAWGSFGYASLSMGRDRYAEYAAQRLARGSVDRLVTGHMQPGNHAGADEQLQSLLGSRRTHVLERCGLPARLGAERRQRGSVIVDAEVERWLGTVALGEDRARQITLSAVADITERLPQAQEGVAPKDWYQEVSRQLRHRRHDLEQRLEREVRRWAFEWSKELHTRTIATVGEGIAELGLGYAGGAVEMLAGVALNEGYCSELAEALREIAKTGPADPGTVPSKTATFIQNLNAKLAGGTAPLVSSLAEGLTRTVREWLFARAAALVAELLVSFARDALTPLRTELRGALGELERARQTSVDSTGIAMNATDLYQAWPDATEGRVPERFATAHNEVVITDVEAFPQQFEADLTSAVASTPEMQQVASPRFLDALTLAVTQVVAGDWTAHGGQEPPRDLLTTVGTWQPGTFHEDPNTGRPLTKAQARYALSTRPGRVLDRARAFVWRGGESFHTFATQGLREYLEESVTDDESAARAATVRQRLHQARAMSLPLLAVRRDLVQQIHGAEVSYRYKFSAIPFAGLPLAKQIQGDLEADPMLDKLVPQWFQEAVTDNPAARIDMFGSYQNYSPLVFDGVFDPIRAEWAALLPHQRHGFWNWRRTRPLPAYLPMSDAERRAMVMGWFVGQALGSIKLPAGGVVDQPARVWDPQAGDWVAFPWPMLTPPDAFLSPQDEWLAAVLESLPLAHLAVHAHGADALKPYRLLRELADRNAQGPRPGTLAAALDPLRAWLTGGSTPSGAPSRAKAAARATTPEDRYAGVVAWMTTIRDHYATEYLPSDGGGGRFGTVTSRDQAAGMPLSADLAADCVAALDELLSLVEQANVDDEMGVF